MSETHTTPVDVIKHKKENALLTVHSASVRKIMRMEINELFLRMSSLIL